MTEHKSTVTVNSRKFDGSIHRSWSAELVEQNAELLTFVGVFDKEVSHPQLGVIRRGTVSYEYYWLDRWYNVFRFHEPGGELRNYYCNVNMPPLFRNGVLDYVDLDLDILVYPDLSHRLLDRQEFEENARRFDYPPDIVEKALTAVTDLVRLVESADFPFILPTKPLHKPFF